MAVVDLSDRRLDPLIDGIVQHYARHLGRLAADFSAAAAFLLSDPLFEALGCGSKCFVQAAKQAYALQGKVSAAEVRSRSATLIAETDLALERLAAIAARDRELLAQQQLNGQVLAETASRVAGEVDVILSEGVQLFAAGISPNDQADPEVLADGLSKLAAKAYEHVRGTWAPILGALTNANLPPAPLAFSGRQIYIETVKLLNQRRLSISEPSTGEHRGIRGLLNQNRKQPQRPTAESQVEIVSLVLNGVSEIIKAAVNGWQRAALERAQRKSLENSSAMNEAALTGQLALLERTIAQLRALRTELAHGLSIRHYYLSLLKQAASCSRSA